MSARTPTPEQAAAIEVGGRDVLLEAGAGTGKTGVMVDRYCRLVCDEGVSPDAILAFTFTDKAAAELRQRIRAELARAGGGRLRARARAAERDRRGLGDDDPRLLQPRCSPPTRSRPGSTPASASSTPPRPTAPPARPSTRRSTTFLAATGERHATAPGPEREELVAAYDVDGLRAVVTGVHAELRSRGEAEPRLPEPPPSDPAGRCAEAAEAAARGAGGAEATSDRQARAGSSGRWRGSPAPGRRPSLDELRGAAHRQQGEGDRRPTARRSRRRSRARRRGGRGRRGLPPPGRAARALLRRASRRPRSAAPASTSRTCRSSPRGCWSGPRSARPTAAASATCWSTSSRTPTALQLRLIEALRGPRSELIVVGDELQSIYGFRHADLDVFREQRRLIEQRPDAELMELSGNFRSRPEVIAAVNVFGAALLGDSYRPLRVGDRRRQRRRRRAGSRRSSCC